MNDQYTELQNALNDAISKVLGEHDGGFVNKWVAIVEVIDPQDGESGLWSLASSKTKAWDVKGLLHHAIDMQLSEEFLRGGDDDE